MKACFFLSMHSQNTVCIKQNKSQGYWKMAFFKKPFYVSQLSIGPFPFSKSGSSAHRYAHHIGIYRYACLAGVWFMK